MEGEWTEAEFVVAGPGQRIAASYDCRRGAGAGMTGKQRILAKLRGEPVDSLPLMPITMMFAADLAGVRYGDYARDHRVLADAQVAVAERFDFDYVSAISDPAREASDLGAAVEWFDDQPPAIVESRALLDDKSKLAGLRLPDLAAPGRMRDRVEAVRLLAERTGATRIVEGWVEGPCAMSADLRGLNTLMLDFFDDPPFVEALFEFTVAHGSGVRARAGGGGRDPHRRRRCGGVAGRARSCMRSSCCPASSG